MTNTHANIFGLTKKGEYKYIWVEKKGQIPIQIYSGWQKSAVSNRNMNIRTGICKYKYKYLSNTAGYAINHNRHIIRVHVLFIEYCLYSSIEFLLSLMDSINGVAPLVTNPPYANFICCNGKRKMQFKNSFWLNCTSGM